MLFLLAWLRVSDINNIAGGKVNFIFNSIMGRHLPLEATRNVAVESGNCLQFRQLRSPKR
jgi:hypothetical protein